MTDFQTVQIQGDDGEWYDVPAPVARRLKEGFAMEIAEKIRSSTGKFQMMREAVAQWLEEGGWKR